MWISKLCGGKCCLGRLAIRSVVPSFSISPKKLGIVIKGDKIKCLTDTPHLKLEQSASTSSLSSRLSLQMIFGSAVDSRLF